MRMSNEELLQALHETVKTAPGRKGRTAEESKELQNWIQTKRRERSCKHQQRQAQLRDHEKQPFRSGGNRATQAQLQAAEEHRVERMRALHQDHETKRRMAASQLMEEILTDKPPQLAYNPTKAKPHVKKKKAAPRSKSLPRKVSTMEHRMPSPRRDEWISFRPERRPSAPESSAAPSPRYAASEPAHAELFERKQYKPDRRPLAEVVRLQRPEATRTKKNRPAPKTYTERLLESKLSGSASPRQMTSPRKMYGSSHLPHAAKKQDRPRVVKSYTERLQDMKHTRTIDTGSWLHKKPIEQKDTRVMRGGRLTELKRAAITPSKPRKTLTYSEQLQQLQPPKETYRSGTSMYTSVKPSISLMIVYIIPRHVCC
jgi:hypothetical protein